MVRERYSEEVELGEYLRVRDRCVELRKSVLGGEQSQWGSELGTSEEPLATVAGEVPAGGCVAEGAERWP